MGDIPKVLQEEVWRFAYFMYHLRKFADPIPTDRSGIRHSGCFGIIYICFYWSAV